MKTAIAVARVSSRAQELDGYSLPSQQRLFDGYLKNKNLIRVKTFSIAETASKSHMRKRFNEIVEFVKKKKIDVIIFEKVDRFTRNIYDLGFSYDWVEADSRHELHFIKEKLVFTSSSSAGEKKQFDQAVISAKGQADTLSEEVLKGYSEMIEQGLYPGQAKFGYKKEGIPGSKHKQSVPDEKSAPILKVLFETYATGNHSIKTITEIAFTLGVRTYKGNRMAKSHIHNLLRDPFPTGYFLWNNVKYKGVHKPIISQDLFDVVQTKLKRKENARYNIHLYVFKGNVLCDECGGMISWYNKKGQNYGQCSNFKPCSQKKCGREDRFEKQIIKEIKKLRIEVDGLKDWIRRALLERYTENLVRISASRDVLQKTFNEIESTLDQLYLDKARGIIDEERFNRLSAKLVIDKTKTAKELKLLNKESSREREVFMMLYDLSQYGEQAYMSAGISAKQTILSLVFKELRMRNGTVIYKTRDWYTIFAKATEETNRKSSKVIRNVSKLENNFEPSIKVDIVGENNTILEAHPEWLDRLDSNQEKRLQRPL